MPYIFTTPSEPEGPAGGHRLFEFYTLDRGITVYRMGTQFFEERYPSQDTLIEADEFWMGGQQYEVSDATADLLTDAGYGEYLTPVA
jgi:hypothetical protein